MQERKEISAWPLDVLLLLPRSQDEPSWFQTPRKNSRQELRHRQLEKLDGGLANVHAEPPLPPPSGVTLGKLLNLSVCSSVN